MPLLLCCTTLAACNPSVPVPIKDETLYYIKGDPAVPASFPNYAVEMHFLTSGQTDLTKAQIDAITQGMVMLSLNGFDDFNKEIADLCSQNTCSYETQAILTVMAEKIKEMRADAPAHN